MHIIHKKLRITISFVSSSGLIQTTQRKTRHHYDKQSTQRRNMYTLCGK